MSDVSPNTRLIFKYHNRRLYDTAARRYTTLSDIRQLVLQGEGFIVRDKQTQLDITFVTLLNVLALAHESRPGALPDHEFLLKAIRAHGSLTPEEPAATELQYTAQSYAPG
jgi:polyhydroxyalkanoate synthesis repressor PhaR